MSAIRRNAYPLPRFAGPSASRVYAVQVRWIIGGLVTLIGLLLCGLIIAGKNDAGASPNTEGATAQVPTTPEPLLFLVTRERIEQGEQITPQMLTTLTLPANTLPVGVVLAQDLEKIAGQFATRMLAPSSPLTLDALSPTPPLHELPIPAGFRAVTVPIDELSSNSYQIRPNQRVDLIMYRNDSSGHPEVTPIVKMVKVLSIGNGTDPREQRVGARSATLLVTADDALRVELSKKVGTLSLVLAGADDVPGDNDSSVPCNESCLVRRGQEQAKLTPSPGKMRTTDPLTHLPVCFELRDGHWQLCPEG